MSTCHRHEHGTLKVPKYLRNNDIKVLKSPKFSTDAVIVPLCWAFCNFSSGLSHSNRVDLAPRAIFSTAIDNRIQYRESPTLFHYTAIAVLVHVHVKFRFINKFPLSSTFVSIWDLFPQNKMRDVAKFHLKVVSRFMMFRLEALKWYMIC